MNGYIHSFRTISVLDSFSNGILSDIYSGSTIIQEPDYSKLIPATFLRRISKVLKLGVSAAISTSENKKLDGIIVASGQGCYSSSIDFINEYMNSITDSISPTAFILSTNNTIAGHIALILSCKEYNTTYVNKGMSFENAMIDAMILSAEKKEDILVGGVDEWVNIFELRKETNVQFPEYWIGEGASFFILNSKSKDALAVVKLCSMVSNVSSNIDEAIYNLLEINNLAKPDLILYGNSFVNEHSLRRDILNIRTINYSEYCGIYFTNSAFGLQMGIEILNSTSFTTSKTEAILVVNNFNDCEFGLFYISKS